MHGVPLHFVWSFLWVYFKIKSFKKLTQTEILENMIQEEKKLQDKEGDVLEIVNLILQTCRMGNKVRNLTWGKMLFKQRDEMKYKFMI